MAAVPGQQHLCAFGVCAADVSTPHASGIEG